MAPASSKGASAGGKGAAGRGKRKRGKEADDEADDRTFNVGDIVDGNYLNKGAWHAGKITKKHEDSNTYDVLYDDGDVEKNMPTSRLSRLQTAAEAAAEAAEAAEEAAVLSRPGKGKGKAGDNERGKKKQRTD